MGAVMANLLSTDLPLLLTVFGRYFFSVLIVYGFMYKLLPSRLNAFVLISLALIHSLWSCVNWSSYYGAPDLFGTAYHFWMNTFINVLTYFIIIFLFRGAFWKKLIVWWYIDVVKTMCEAVAHVPVLLYHAGHGENGDWAWLVLSVESNATLKLLHMSAMISLFLLLGYLSLTIWRGILMRKFHPFYLLFIALPMGIKYSLSYVFHPGMGDWFLWILINFTDLKTSYYILSIFG
ncbi:MAG: hypothetical protein LBC28_01615, partial [Oscillospiraceae bacterium]|nr:hypothetical protein [Oscillospiraceae bacterium]